MSNLVPVEIIAKKIYLIRREKIMLDRDLAELYGVETRVLNQAVRRNIKRFPGDFMFSLTRDEIRNLSQFVISSKIKHAPNVFAFTEQGVAMLSGVLNSERAILVNISIMRVFSKLKQLALSHSELLRKVDALERKYGEHDKKIAVIFQALKKLLLPPPLKPKGKMGF
ncbi:MAG: ORF6N domain-containing protein [Candidatus Omnitrophota bacterium]|nr:ORF6N domain-containing protein [Candidatus Omnitrophota bacterium]MBU2527759.1 ORF6N domain-containing protein [bacterium]MBU3930441.1 ORF6N domain-containing protein [bacterium]MBU4122560.1 ORF6N domain-containing protein [bacterium]